MKQQPILKVSGLSKVYPNGDKPLTVFSHLNFEAATGEVTAFLGPSGCGKSTFLECITGLTACKGEIELDGKSPKAAVSQKEIGLAFQEAALIDWMTVEENILLPSQIGKRVLSGSEAIERLENLLKLMGLESFRNFYPAQLSGGMKQRVALARALLHTPKLLLLDEPFSSLDSLTRLRIMIEFKSVLNKAKTCTILITHNIEEAAYLADRIFILSPLPAKILYEIPVKYQHPRNAGLLDREEFNNVIIECRKKLLIYAQ